LKKYISIVVSLLISLVLFSSCSREDDIEEIFVGKTWYMVGGELNGQALNTEVKSFYDSGKTCYLINFQANTFTGTLSSGTTFSGRWNVNAKTRALSLTISNDANPSIPFDRNIYSVLKKISYYEGDSNILILYQDRENFIRLNNER